VILDVPNFDRSRIDESSQSIENIRLIAVSIGADASYGTDMSDTVAIFGLDAHVFVLRFFAIGPSFGLLFLFFCSEAQFEHIAWFGHDFESLHGVFVAIEPHSGFYQTGSFSYVCMGPFL